MQDNTIVERTDFTQSRLVAGAKSLANWFRFETLRLSAEKRLFRKELTETDDAQNRAELVKALNENLKEQRLLDRGWENSSLRAKVEKSAERKEEVTIGGIESRLLTSAPKRESLLQAEPRATNQNKPTQLSGYAAVFDKPSEDLGGFVEVIRPGAFTEAIKISDVKGLINHNADLIFSRTGKSLRLYEDNHGLKFYADLLQDDPLTNSTINRVGSGIWTQMSFAFTPKEDTWELAKKPGDIDRRIIIKIKELYDISIVSYPAYKQTSVSLLFEEKRDLPVRNTNDDYGDVDGEYAEFMKNEERGRRLEYQLKAIKLRNIINRNRNNLCKIS